MYICVLGRLTITCDSSLCGFRYLDNKVFVSLANGDITVYARDHGN